MLTPHFKYWTMLRKTGNVLWGGPAPPRFLPVERVIGPGLRVSRIQDL